MQRGILVALAIFGLADAAVAESFAFVNINVLPMSREAIIAAQTVVVKDGVITALGAVEDTAVPDAAEIIDGTDRYLMPGLAEMHGHVPGGNSVSLERTLLLFVANGITTVRGMLGQPAHLVLREALARNEVLGPRLITSGPSFNGRSVSGPNAARRMVREQQAAGFDFLKVHPGLTREEFDAMAETANELGIPFAGHVPEDVGVERALAAGIATIDHLDGYMESLLPAHRDPSGGLSGFFGVFIAGEAKAERIPGVVEATHAAGTWNVPTQSLFEHVASPGLAADDLAALPEMKYMPAATVAEWRRAKTALLADPSYSAANAERAVQIRRQLILALHRAGAGLLLGSDAPQVFNVPGFSLHRELEFLVAAGLSPYEALRTGTVNPATFFADPKSGAVGVGMTADLVVLDANPLEDIANSRRIHGVMLGGRWLARADLDDRLARIAR